MASEDVKKPGPSVGPGFFCKHVMRWLMGLISRSGEIANDQWA